jgi:hypothetical protein
VWRKHWEISVSRSSADVVFVYVYGVTRDEPPPRNLCQGDLAQNMEALGQTPPAQPTRIDPRPDDWPTRRGSSRQRAKGKVSDAAQASAAASLWSDRVSGGDAVRWRKPIAGSFSRLLQADQALVHESLIVALESGHQTVTVIADSDRRSGIGDHPRDQRTQAGRGRKRRRMRGERDDACGPESRERHRYGGIHSSLAAPRLRVLGTRFWPAKEGDSENAGDGCPACKNPKRASRRDPFGPRCHRAFIFVLIVIARHFRFAPALPDIRIDGARVMTRQQDRARRSSRRAAGGVW